MCYNTEVELTKEQIAEAFDLTNAAVTAWEGPNAHIGIGQNLPAIVQSADGRELEMMYWGFTPAWWSKDEKGGLKPGNARADTVATTPLFRGSFKSKRCIVPATGFYEWIGEKGQKRLLPFSLLDRPIFAFPGIWDEWKMPNGTTRRSVAIITTDPNIDFRVYHDRMPVVLDRDDEAKWLSPETKPGDLQTLLMPLADSQIVAHPDRAFSPSRG